MSKYSSSSQTAGKAIRFRTEVSAAAIYNEVEASGPDGRPGSPGRKVRTPQSSVPDNVRASSVPAGRRPVPQKTYRLPACRKGKGDKVRQGHTPGAAVST